MKRRSIQTRRSTATIFVAALAVATATVAQAASASSEDYRGCDGYGAASDSGDGMTKYANTLFIFNLPGYGNTDKSSTNRGSMGVANCDAALADLPSQHWRRRASLLRARAMHHLDTGDNPAALADLDLADAAAKDNADPFYTRSLGLGIDIVRAYAIRRSGDQARAETLAMQSLSQRPYNRQTAISVLIAMGPAASQSNVEDATRTLARLVPTAVDDLFLKAFDTGHFADAILLFSQLTPPREIGDVNISAGEQEERGWRDYHTAEVFWASRGGAYAYALAATGKNAEATAAIEAARARLAKDTQPPPPLSDEEAKDAVAAAAHQGLIAIRESAAAESKTAIDEWALMVERRIMVSEGKVNDVLKTLHTQPMLRSWASVDLLDAMVAATPKEHRPATSPSLALRAALESDRINGPDPGMDVFFQSLPDAETAARVPTYEKASKPWLAMTGSQADLDTEGYRVSTPDDQGVTSISFRGDRSSGSIVEEMALLCAADTARQAGKKGLIVVGRKDTSFHIDTTYYGNTVRSDPDGYQTELDVVFVDPAALPPQYADAGWRVIDADAVYTALAPIYVKPAASR